MVEKYYAKYKLASNHWTESFKLYFYNLTRFGLRDKPTKMTQSDTQTAIFNHFSIFRLFLFSFNLKLLHLFCSSHSCVHVFNGWITWPELSRVYDWERRLVLNPAIFGLWGLRDFATSSVGLVYRQGFPTPNVFCLRLWAPFVCACEQLRS